MVSGSQANCETPRPRAADNVLGSDQTTSCCCSATNPGKTRTNRRGTLGNQLARRSPEDVSVACMHIIAGSKWSVVGQFVVAAASRCLMARPTRRFLKLQHY